MIAADADRVPAGQLLGAELEDVRHQAHGGARREDVRAAGDVLLEYVVLYCSADLSPGYSSFLGRGYVECQQDRRGGVDGHRRADGGKGQAVEEDFHVGERTDRHAHSSDLPLRLRRVGVVSHLRRQIERHRQPRLALLEEVAETAVRFLGRGEAGVLAHRPESAAVHGRLDAARVWVLTRPAKVTILVQTG